MKILHINNCDIKGGAAKVGCRLCRELIKQGHDVLYLVARKYSGYGFVREIKKIQPQHYEILKRILNRLGISALSLEVAFPFNLDRDFIDSFDVIHLHDVTAGYFNIAGLTVLSRRKPVIWTLHTMWPFTGGCLYSYRCERWKGNCGKCPQFGKFPLDWIRRDGSFLAMGIKKIIYRLSDILLVGTSEWVSNLARKSILGRFDIKTVKNPVDTEIFRPIDKRQAKQKLKIPPEAKTVIFSVGSKPEDKRKGIDVILNALTLLKTRDISFLPLCITEVSGNKLEEALKNRFSLSVTHVEDEEKLNLFYNAADLLWHPSLADTSSLSIIEAFSAGTPVVASEVGGVREIVTDGKNGFFMKSGSSVELAEKTDFFFSSEEEKKAMSENARKVAVSEHSADACAGNYLKLYAKAIALRNKRSKE